MITAALVWMLVVSLLSAIMSTSQVGKDRKPIDAGTAALTVLIQMGAFTLALLALWGHLR